MTSHAWALLLYALVTIGYTWPLASGLDRLVPHDLGDPLLSTWTLWWNAHVVPFSDRWWDGLAFHPAHDTLTFSDHRVGLGLIASPAIWAGGAPITAHNIAFLLSFFLSAAGAYALCFSLTKSRAAAFVGGLVFGFNPYRAAHLPHLELLSSYWLPLVLLGLHRWSATLRTPWLVLTAGALVMQGLTSGYYFVFLGVLIGLWLIWFLRRRLELRQHVGLAVALIGPLLLVAPIFLRFRLAHQAMGLSRGIGEIEDYSADLIGLWTTPRLLALWSSPEAWRRPEGEIWPGAVAVVLVLCALWASRRSRGTKLPPWGRRLRTIALTVAAVMLGVALIPPLFGPVAYELLGLRISISDSYKPLSIATIFGGVWALTSARVRQAFHDRSPLAFYTLATIAMWLFALGPTARLLGHRVLYKAPYAWLMMLPGFGEGFRVPARFAMLAALTLSVAAALAFRRLMQGRPARTRLVATALTAALVAAESWIRILPTPAAPAPLTMPAAMPGDAVVLELPVGLMEDAIAMYRSIHHGRRIVNGMSGFEPPHYTALRVAIEEGRYEALEAVATHAPIAIFVQRDPAGAELSMRMTARLAVRPMATTDTHEVVLLPQESSPQAQPVGDGGMLPVQQLSSSIERERLAAMLDGNRDTVWVTNQPQAGTEAFVADLGAVTEIDTVVVAQGASRLEFPRALGIDLSANGLDWSEAWRGDTAAMAVAAAVSDPREMRMRFEVGPRRGRYVRVRQIGQSHYAWGVAEFRVYGFRR